MHIPRREFLSTLGLTGAATALPFNLFGAAFLDAQLPASPFRIAVINDEITQDFGRACEIASRDFGMRWIELRSMWKKNVVNLDSSEIAEAHRILKKFELQVTDIASPLFKTDWPGAPKSKYSPKSPQFGADFTFNQQDEVLSRSMNLAKEFRTDRIRCFDFWRLADQTPYRAAMNAKLLETANKVGKEGITLVLENEPSCNTATGAEAAKVLAAIQSPHLMLNWDPGNAASVGERPFPDGYSLLPKDRIGHCHVKDTVKKTNGSYDWAPVGKGLVDWVGQFKALKSDGYHFAVSLETHWDGGGSPEASTRKSWAGMKEALQKAGAL